MNKTILVTGGAGYIGSHTCVELLEQGYDVIVVDNLSNSKVESLRCIEKITGKSVKFYQIDICDETALEAVFVHHKIAAVIHFAGLKAVGESCQQPLSYYWNNVYGTLVLLKLMTRYRVTKLIFSSSATVYGLPHSVPITENFPLSTTNPYGRSKLIIEEMLRDLTAASDLNATLLNWNITILRYFNPIGAHSSGLIGEDPNGIPNNLMPYMTQVALGKLAQLAVFGDDYATKDGTGVRDYIHVVDLAKGHLKALESLENSAKNNFCNAYNLGTGCGYSVLDMITAFERVTKKQIAYKIVERRAGDIAECYANASLALENLDWQAEKNLDEMIIDAWRWQSTNPNGY